ncbi:MAG: hypothetical protein IJS29_01810 [Selenomonadaceae bacterium]|nr:hypothetical protein [Selenomonadaceae bacterium]
MKDFLKSQLEEIRENKLRFGLLIICLVVAIIYAFADSFDSGEEINLDAPQKVAQVESPAKNISSTSEKVTVTSDKVKAVIGANADDVFIYDPFKNPAPAKVDEPVKVDEVDAKVEKTLPPAEPAIVTPPAVEVPTPPEDNFILRGTALANNKTAMVEKISNGKSETLFLQIGEKINGKAIVDIAQDFITLDDGNILYIE